MVRIKKYRQMAIVRLERFQGSADLTSFFAPPVA